MTAIVDAISNKTSTFGLRRPTAILLPIVVTGSPGIHATARLPWARGANGIFRPTRRQAARRDRARIWRPSTRRCLPASRERRVRGGRWIHDTSTTSITDCSPGRVVADAGARSAAGTAIPSVSTGLVAVVWILLLMSSFLFLLNGQVTQPDQRGSHAELC